MNNIRNLRQISLNRKAYFKKKNQNNQELNPVIKSHDGGPQLHRDQIMGAIKYFAEKTQFQDTVDSLPTIPVPHNSTMDLVIVTVIDSPRELWSMVLNILVNYPLRKIIAVWYRDEDLENIQDLQDMYGSLIQFIYLPIEKLVGINMLWQKGIQEASIYKSEAIMILKSSDLVTYQYCKTAMRKIRDGYELIGSRNWMDIYCQDSDSWDIGRPDLIRLSSYNEKRHDFEFIGSGRVISTYLLLKMKWNLFGAQKPLNDGLDKHSYYLIKQHNPKIYHLPLDTGTNIGIIKISNKNHEDFEKRDPRRPGNAWITKIILKTKYVDYLISEEVYQTSIKLFYGNFGQEVRVMRKRINEIFTDNIDDSQDQTPESES